MAAPNEKASAATIAPAKKRLGYPEGMGAHPLFRHDFAHHEAMYQSARAFLWDVFGTAQRDIDALGRKSARALDRVFAVAQRLNGKGGDPVLQLQTAFGDRLYVELQRHGLPEEAAAEGVVERAGDRDVLLVLARADRFVDPAALRFDLASDSPLRAVGCLVDLKLRAFDEVRKVRLEKRKRRAAFRALFPRSADHGRGSAKFAMKHFE